MQPVLFDIGKPKLKSLPLEEVEKEFEAMAKDKLCLPVFLLQDVECGRYFTSRNFSRKTIESYKNFKIIKSTDKTN